MIKEQLRSALVLTFVSILLPIAYSLQWLANIFMTLTIELMKNLPVEEE